MPLCFVVLVNGIKDFCEDFKRKQSDNRENNTKCLLLVSQKKHKKKKNSENEIYLKETAWKDLKPGNIVRINKDDNFPADLVLLYSSNKNGSAFTETKNLDGETNLKYRECIKNIFMHLKNFHSETEIQNELKKLNGHIECDDPNPHLYEFKGIFNVLNMEQFESLSPNNNSCIIDRRKSLLTEDEYNKEVVNMFRNILKEGNLLLLI